MSGRHDRKKKKPNAQKRPVNIDDHPVAETHPGSREENHPKQSMKTYQKADVHWTAGATLLTTVVILYVYMLQSVIMHDTLYLDQRPWMTANFLSCQFLVNQPITVPIKIVVTGKTPAMKITGEMVAEILHKGDELRFTYNDKRRGGFGYGALSPAGAPADVHMVVLEHPPGEEIRPQLLSPETKRELDSGVAWVVAYGKVSYYDRFGVEHEMTFCTLPDAPHTGSTWLDQCASYNNTDNNQPPIYTEIWPF